MREAVWTMWTRNCWTTARCMAGILSDTFLLIQLLVVIVTPKASYISGLLVLTTTQLARSTWSSRLITLDILSCSHIHILYKSFRLEIDTGIGKAEGAYIAVTVTKWSTYFGLIYRVYQMPIFCHCLFYLYTLLTYVPACKAKAMCVV